VISLKAISAKSYHNSRSSYIAVVSTLNLVLNLFLALKMFLSIDLLIVQPLGRINGQLSNQLLLLLILQALSLQFPLLILLL